MVVAYLRGLLKPSLNYGLRSIVSESYVLEMLMADTQTHTLEVASMVDASVLPAMNEKSKHSTLADISRRRIRCQELRNGDIYRVGKARHVKQSGGISMYQLYHLCSKAGIMEQLAGAEPTA